MTRILRLVCVAALFTPLAACSSSTSTDDEVVRRATGTLRNSAGASAGTVALAEQRDGTVRVDVSVTGFSAGQHGMHVHAIGSCDAAGSFSSAGAHFNPTGKQHGLQNPNGAHGGDLPNIEVGAAGTGSLQTTTRRVSLTTGVLNALDADGAAVVVHAGTDDQVTDPQGNSGARFACAVLTGS